MADTFAIAADDRDDFADVAAGAVQATVADVRAQMAKKLATTIPDRFRGVFRQSWWDRAVDSNAIPRFAEIAGDTIEDFEDAFDLDLSADTKAGVGAGAVGTAIGLLNNRFMTVRDRVRSLHRQAIDEDWDPDQLAEALGLDGGAGILSDASADAIGRSLATLLTERSGIDTLAAADVTGTKTWRALDDGRARPEHADADGQTVMLDEPFDIGGNEAMHPGDDALPAELAINCRCWLDYSVDESATGDATLDEDTEALAATAAGPIPPSAKEHPVPTLAVPDLTAFAIDASQVCITVEPTAAEKQALAAVADSPAELHVPLLWLGAVSDLTPDQRVAVATTLANVAAGNPPLSGAISGTGYLSTDVTVGIVDCPGLTTLRGALVDALAELATDPGEFLPAIWLSAGSVDASSIAGTPVHFNEIRLHVATETLVFDLLGPIASSPEPEPVPSEAGPPAPPEAPPASEPAPPEEAPSMATMMTTYGTTTTNSANTVGNLVKFAEPGAMPEDQPATDEPPAVPLTDIPDGDLEAEIARRAAEAAAEATGGAPDDLIAAAEEETAGLIAEITAELQAPAPADDSTDTPPPADDAAYTASVTNPATLADGDLAPDVDGNGIGEDVEPAETFDWEGVLAIEGTPTSDGRMFAEGALTWRTLPLTLALQTVTAPGHDGAVVCGSICEIERVGATIVGRGRFSSTEAGDLARTLIEEGSLRGVSIDVASAVVVYTDENGDEVGMEDVMFGEVDATAVFVQAEMMAATLTPFPAFADASVGLVDDTATSLVAVSGTPGIWRLSGPALFTLGHDTAALVASAAPTVPHPPETLFALKPDTKDPFTVGAPLPDGSIPCYGLIATWKTAHIGIPGRKVYAPRDDDFAYFHTGSKVLTAEGTLIPTGPIFMDTVHPDLARQASDAQAFYAHTGCAVADVRLYAGEHGIVAAGVIRPGVDELTTRRFRASKVSGDWRPIEGRLRMVAVLAVNSGGFPVPFVEGIAASAGTMRPWAAFDSAGEPLAMVAVGAVHREPTAKEIIADLQAQIADNATRLAALESAFFIAAAASQDVVVDPVTDPDVDDDPAVTPDRPAPDLPDVEPQPDTETAPVGLSADERAARTRAALERLARADDGPVELSADERATRRKAALAQLGLPA